MRSRWKWLRYRLEHAALVLTTTLIPLLPRKCCLALARVFGALMSRLDRRSFRVAVSNLEAAFGDRFTVEQREEIARQSFQHFARSAVDLLWSSRLTREKVSRLVELENFEEMQRSIGPEWSVLIACYHYGNFEWLSLACAYIGLNGSIITQEFKNTLLEPVFRRIRERTGHKMVPRERGIMRLYKIARRKGRIALLVDLTIPPRRGAVAIECFGLKTSVTAAHVWLNEQTGIPLVPAHCEPLPNGRYRIVFHPKIEIKPGQTHQEVAQACWNSFEPYVRKNPAPWLWMYKHWRYRPANAARSYPFYSGFSLEFEALLRKTEGTPG